MRDKNWSFGEELKESPDSRKKMWQVSYFPSRPYIVYSIFSAVSFSFLEYFIQVYSGDNLEFLLYMKPSRRKDRAGIRGLFLVN